MKLYRIHFEPMCPVPHGLIILAENPMQARSMAKKTITHTKADRIEEIEMDNPKVVFYESGDY